jgi:HAD superfamily hydrolase (TIGR01509 family)
MPLRNCKYWIFDMDGTLTLPIHDFEWIRQKLGLAQGTPILEAINEMPEPEGRRATQLLHDLEMELAHKAKPQPGIESILQSLIDNGKRLGILTRNGREITRTTLIAAGLAGFFEGDSIICRDTCAPKPSPDGVLHLLEIWGASKEETVIVGDFLYDIEAGYHAGIHTVHYDYQGVFSWPEYTHQKITRLDQLQSMM